MGILASRNRSVSENLDPTNSNPIVYRYPPKQGNYFANYFIMGGERFEVQQPEAYLFGDNADLNFLGTRPVPFPYSAPQSNEPTKTLKALINVRKESVRFIRFPAMNETDEMGYTVEFIFDSDVSCSLTVHFVCTEEPVPHGVRYVSRAGPQPETFHYKPGAGQVFNQPSIIWKTSTDALTRTHIQTSLYPSGALMTRVADAGPMLEGDMVPVVIVCQAEEGDEPRQHQATYCLIERSSDGSFVLKALKQKLYVDGLAYLLQDIYGIENKHVHNREIPEVETEGEEDEAGNEESEQEEDDDEGGGECVICMSEQRDTLILPCRHLCLCQPCADSLRYQANNCPICRVPFRALLQIRALRKLPIPQAEYSHLDDCVPLGYEAVSLLEALNGPTVAPRHSGRRRTMNPDSTQNRNATAAQNSPRQTEDTTVTVNEENTEPEVSLPDDVERETANEESCSSSYIEAVNVHHLSLSPTSICNQGWHRMQNGRRSLGAVANDVSNSNPSTIQGPLRRTRSAHARRPIMNPNISLLGPRGLTSPSLRSSGDSCSSADSTRRLVKPAQLHPMTNINNAE